MSSHLAMCARMFSLPDIVARPMLNEADCSDLIMATSQECPLCRTRIVTPCVVRVSSQVDHADYRIDNGSSEYIGSEPHHEGFSHRSYASLLHRQPYIR